MTIERFDFESRDIAKSNVEKIGELFPGVITEKMDENGVLKRAIDFDKLMAVLRDDVVEKGKERYEFTWPGKRQAMAEANKSINKTLRPVVEESKDWDNTENLYIEGDNLEVLKLLQESYLGKIKMIYIDPPYNTGNDFVYNDDFKKNLDQYNEDNADYDEEGGKLIKNTESNGRFHSDWCSMIYPRLRLARNLLSDDGVIFISIDDNEQGNLKKICDEVFGEENHIENLIWKRRSTPPNDRVIGKNHEYIYLYSKNNNSYKLNLQRRTAQMNSNYKNPDNDPRGAWNYADLSGNGKGGRLVESCVYPIQDPSTGKKHMPPKNKCWLYNESKMNELLNDNRIVFRGENGTPYQKRFLKDVRDGATLPTLIDDVNVDYSIDISKSGTSQNSAKEIKDLFNEDIFEFPKPVSLIDKLMVAGSNFDSYVLDFFSGSATTAHAVMDLNAEDGGKRKYIMVQLPEATDENSEAYKAGYKNICEIGKERIRRAGDKILADNKDKEGIEKLDIGFRVFRVDSTNMKDVYFSPELYEQNFLLKLQSNIKEDRNDLDLLFACLLDWGLPIDRPYSVDSVGSSNIHIYNHGDLVACFSENLSENIIKRIAELKPLMVVFRDSSFGSSEDKINVEEIFKVYSPETDIRVL